MDYQSICVTWLPRISFPPFHLFAFLRPFAVPKNLKIEAMTSISRVKHCCGVIGKVHYVGGSWRLSLFDDLRGVHMWSSIHSVLVGIMCVCVFSTCFLASAPWTDPYIHRYTHFYASFPLSPVLKCRQYV